METFVHEGVFSLETLRAVHVQLCKRLVYRWVWQADLDTSHLYMGYGGKPRNNYISYITRSTARIAPRAKQLRCVGRDDSYAGFVVFAQDRLTDEINRVFAIGHMGERSVATKLFHTREQQKPSVVTQLHKCTAKGAE